MSNGMENGAKPRVKLCAIAKDEGAYLAYWVFHHLYFGFDEIHICLNRTTDNSAAILDEIAKTHPNVTYSYYDWVDFLPPAASKRLQQIAYAYELQRARDEQLIDYMMFLDVDEFWCPSSFNESIGDCVRHHGCPDLISYLWAMEPGYEKPFSYLQLESHYKITGQVKTLFHIDLSVDIVRLHVPEVSGTARHVLAGGEDFVGVKGNSQVYDLKKQDLENIPYFICHRVCRSKNEYMYSLLRGNPEVRYQIKLNRNFGYFGPELCNWKFVFPGEAFERYSRFISLSFESFDIAVEVMSAQKFILDESLRFYTAFEAALRENPESAANVVFGLDDDVILSMVSSYDAALALKFQERA